MELLHAIRPAAAAAKAAKHSLLPAWLMDAGTATVSTVVETSYTGFNELAIQITLNIPFNGGSGVERWAAWLLCCPALPCPACQPAADVPAGGTQEAQQYWAARCKPARSAVGRSFPFPQKLPSTKST